ncbi:hypothetical protein WV31_13195 [Magnetospirillum sp. ME-1]|uniref:formyltransferase family protein n=1 Tax=Magnetospirillum sp. ME-1 TaxID=1639348 RepID=UPI000A17A0D8|nr:formyltransferase family protein [Magnetospirillum sp. ME-1]ARJ66555.1 hypothetical protein WV31_13195 [Magnetospirillum sp. ME-1]
MKILLISGSHPRHFFVHRAVRERFDVAGVILMQREDLLPEPPAGIAEHDRLNFIRHFSDRARVESIAYADATESDVVEGVPVHRCTPQTINDAATASFAAKINADAAVILGPDIIKTPLFEALPQFKMNIHLGLSPWYRGSATLFWPFYNLEPQCAGATFHLITPEADGGPIVHQCVPELREGDGIHDVGARTVQSARRDLILLLEKLERFGKLELVEQRWAGKLYLSRHFRPEHLRVIYDLFDGKIVDKHLSGELSGNAPKLVQPNL